MADNHCTTVGGYLAARLAQIGLNDYFTYCYFQLLNGDRKWMDAFPNKPPGE